MSKISPGRLDRGRGGCEEGVGVRGTGGVVMGEATSGWWCWRCCCGDGFLVPNKRCLGINGRRLDVVVVVREAVGRGVE